VTHPWVAAAARLEVAQPRLLELEQARPDWRRELLAVLHLAMEPNGRLNEASVARRTALVGALLVQAAAILRRERSRQAHHAHINVRVTDAVTSVCVP
jgi:hypothetical protein